MKSLSHLAGQLIMVRLQGTALDEPTADFLRKNHIRAVCLFRQNMVDAAQLKRFTQDLRRVMGASALIAIDQEGGAVTRTTWLPTPPSAMALAAVDDEGLAFEVGAAVARSLRSLGFNWNFAPVLDVNSNPQNPVIAERSFGRDPQRVAQLAHAWMRGHLSEGVACCIKHAPGHGDTHTDSHRALPRVDKPRAALEQVDFVPFRALSGDAPAVMSAHILYPALDAHLPATLSRPILTDLIRGDWQFKGAVITDAMDMQAIAAQYGTGNAASLALQAGADMVMALGPQEAQRESLAAMEGVIDSGKLPRTEVDAKLQRLNTLARRFPIVPAIPESAPDDAPLMRSAWRRALTTYGQPRRIPAGSAIRLIMRHDVSSDGITEAGVSSQHLMQCLQRHYDVVLTPFKNAEQFEWSSLPDDGRITVLASVARLRYGENVRRNWRPDIHLALWSPYLALDMEAPALLTYGFADAAIEAAIDWLLDRLQTSGRNPVF